MKVNKFKVLLYLKKSNLDKQVEKPLYFDPFGPNNINHLVQVSLEFFCVDLRPRVLV